jgi:hypothetical protein
MSGYTYEVSDEQLFTYAATSIDAKLRWLDEAQRMTYALATPEVRARWRELRKGISLPTVEPPREDAAPR